MSKAEDKALKAYPIKIAEREGYDENLRERKGFVKGYHQAEKDLELGWEDVARLFVIASTLTIENTAPLTDKAFYQEVLKRFHERKH